jgi:hypothetical protein
MLTFPKKKDRQARNSKTRDKRTDSKKEVMPLTVVNLGVGNCNKTNTHVSSLGD